MKNKAKFWGIHAAPSKWLSWFLFALPFVLLILGYLLASEYRHRQNPSDKLLPSFSKMATTMQHVAFEKNKRTGEYQLLSDTLASLKRIGTGLGMAALLGVICGLNLGLFPGIRHLFLPLLTFVSIIPPLAILPMLFIVFGVDELAKVVLIFIGTFPVITRDIYLTVKKIPREQIVKTLTLGASQISLVYRVVLPQIFPRLIETVRINMGPAWLFLIASEAIAAQSGLGYRIFLVRRYLAMDMIIPYVLWIVCIGITVDWILKSLLRYKFSWYMKQQG
ncbi:ABC transporter permease [Desulfogranum japonicum]|uniref:ABC transporter permease n=1 Tax=Desulfogranum japonicum TaxID=231447 RepID=UPI00041FE9D1|nr:ABC transporter permease [Desulfogranum japonicum]